MQNVRELTRSVRMAPILILTNITVTRDDDHDRNRLCLLLLNQLIRAQMEKTLTLHQLSSDNSESDLMGEADLCPSISTNRNEIN